MGFIASQFLTVKNNIEASALLSMRKATDVKLVVVSKGEPAATIEEAIKGGAIDFGESKWQEASQKWPPLLLKYPHLKLHFIGPLQANKISVIAQLFHVIHSVGAISHLKELRKFSNKETSPLPQLLLQVNIAAEPQKSGVLVEDLEAFIRLSRHEYQINYQGLMAIPPLGADAKPYFMHLKNLADHFNFLQLSMGMSQDYVQAVEEGSTLVRVGSAIFKPLKTSL